MLVTRLGGSSSVASSLGWHNGPKGSDCCGTKSQIPLKIISRQRHRNKAEIRYDHKHSRAKLTFEYVEYEAISPFHTFLAFLSEQIA